MFALSPSGKLLGSFPDAGAETVATSVTSFTFTDEYLIYTTTAHMSFYAPLNVVRRILAGGTEAWELEWESRRIERGALAVVACPSSMSLVLQMPRGNLETIYPRPLVLAVVRRDVLRSLYVPVTRYAADKQRRVSRCVHHLPKAPTRLEHLT
jgi:elongator complex protein 1